MKSARNSTKSPPAKKRSADPLKPTPQHLVTAKSLLTLLGAALLLAPATARAAEKAPARFEPPAGKVLVFVGQDNASVGGTEKFKNGYVDNLGVPGGITHYVYFSEGWTNKFNRTFAKGSVAGLNTETEWAAGPMHQKAYLDSPKLANCVMHVSIAMEGNCEDKVADGSFDHLIAEFVKFIADHPEHPFLIRIGYEFDGSWNAYDPENFKKAFRRIVDALRAAKLTNYATVMASSGSEPQGKWEEYWPGDDYVDWVGFSYWGQAENEASHALAFARKVGKPIFIAESTPRGIFFDKGNHEEIWNGWFEKFFKYINDNIDVVRAVSYINSDWDALDMWDGWGQTRIETAPLIKTRWLEKMADPRFVNAANKPFELIGFKKSAAGANNNVEPYRDPSRPVDERVKDLLGRMNLQEKVAQLHSWWHYDERKLLSDGAIFTPEFYGSICPNGVGTLGPLHNLKIDDDVRMYAAVQEYFRKRTRLGIPPLIHDEAAHGFMRFEANSFPAPVALSCTWNPELMERIYTQTAREARNRGINQVLSPVVDIARDLRWGRVDETPGEDAFLAGRIGAAMVRGLQGSADGTIASGHVAATLKHFAGYAGTVGGLNRSPYPNGPRHLLDNEVEPFRHAIAAAKPSGVMAAYNEIEGVPCHVNSWLLTEVLRGKLGFEGIVVGDYQGIDLVRQYQKIGNSDADGARMAFDGGLQMELPNNFGFQHLPGLVEQGKIKIERIDHAVSAVLALKFRLGLFEAPMTIDPAVPKAITSAPAATELACEAARQAIVLLKNDKNLLPLTPGAHKNIAVIGPNADACRLGSYSGKPQKTVSLLAGIKTFLGDKATVTHATGCKIAHNDTGLSYDNWRYIDDIQYASLDDNRPLIAEAVEMAKNSDLVILALGHSELLGREAWGSNHIGDRSTLDLTDSEKVLAEQVLATGKPVVLFLNNGKPITLHQLNDRIPAILTAHYAGQETGTAAAEILFGQTNPSGKLTISWPRDVGHLPCYYSQQSSARVFNYLDAPTAPIYPFGHGLSYTKFSYGNPQLSANQIRPGESVTVSFDVTNSGSRPGTEVVQVYATGEEFEIARPRLELKGFDRIALNPGETKKAEIQIAAKDLEFHNQKLERVLPRGKYQIRVGGSSESLGSPVTLETVPTAQ